MTLLWNVGFQFREGTNEFHGTESFL